MKIVILIYLIALSTLFSGCTSVECNNPFHADCDFYFKPRIEPQYWLRFNRNDISKEATLINEGRIKLHWRVQKNPLIENVSPDSTGALEPGESVELGFSLYKPQLMIGDLGNDVQIIITSENHSDTLKLPIINDCASGIVDSGFQGYFDNACSSRAGTPIGLPQSTPCLTSGFRDNSWRSIKFYCVPEKTQIQLFDDRSGMAGTIGNLQIKKTIDGLCFNDLDTDSINEYISYHITPSDSVLSGKISRICILN